MQLLLWRHAHALAGEEDWARPLSRKGERQAVRVGAWLRPRLPAGIRVLCSPALRAIQTVEALELGYEVAEWLAPDADPADVLELAAWPAGGDALLVGHQPWLGQAAALALAGSAIPWSMRKGALWWLERRLRAGDDETALRLAVDADAFSGL